MHYVKATDIERSHTELRAAVILACQEIRKLNLGCMDSPVLKTLSEVLRAARVVAEAEREKGRVRTA
jgi:hypothetical protein